MWESHKPKWLASRLQHLGYRGRMVSKEGWLQGRRRSCLKWTARLWRWPHQLQVWTFPLLVAQTVKRLSTVWETGVRTLGWEDPWRRKWQKIPWTEEPGRLQSMGSQSRTRLSDFTFHCCFLLEGQHGFALTSVNLSHPCH